MLATNLKLAWRNLKRNRSFSVINILGLSIGMATTIFILLWVQDERSWDKFQKNYENTWQVFANRDFNGEKFTDVAIAIPVAQSMEENLPQVEAASFTSFSETHVLKVEDKIVKQNALRVSPHYFDIFEWDFIKGDKSKALTSPDAIILTKSSAIALFGTTDILDKVVRLDNQFDVHVTAVVNDPPTNSSQQFQFITPYNVEPAQMQDWVNSYTSLFVKTKPGADESLLSGQFNELMFRNTKDSATKFLMHPMSKWRLYSDFENGVNTGGMISYVRLFSIIAIVILLIACVNFMNLSTARSEKRAKEVGIRKTLGSERRQLIFQFISESVMVALIALAAAIAMVYFLLPFFNQLVEKQMQLDLADSSLWIAAGLIVLFTGIFAGSYPALYLSGFNPVKVLKGTFLPGKASVLPRKVLVVGQFVISIVLVSATMVVFRQIQHVKARDLGYNPANLVSVPYSPEARQSFDAIKQEMLQSGLISNVTRTSAPLTDIWNFTPAPDYEGKPTEGNMVMAAMRVSDDFTKTTGIRIVEGRDFTGGPADSSSLLLNRAAVKVMGLKEPVGMAMRIRNRHFTVIGVTDDVVMASPFRPVDPMMMIYHPNSSGFIQIRLADKVKPQDAILALSGIFKKHTPSVPFEYQFIDEQFNRKFVTEDLISKLANIFAGLAIFICCLGLSGLAAFTVQKRIREIGIRKVMGASVRQVLLLLSREFLLLVAIALLIAVPIAWYAMHEWLQQYAYRTSIAIWQFAAAGVFILLLTLITVCLNAMRAARMKPAMSLRTE